MVLVIIGFFVSILVVVGILWFLWSSGFSELWLREKTSHFECGLEVKGKARVPLSVRFFFFLLLFLVFDVEISFLIYYFFQVGNYFVLNVEVVLGFFIIVMLGLVEEWRRGCLA
uniref:NADH-ubiquinone oxidoreductase chain 3 n=1 Tax=Syndesmis echinorum TaxID=2019369 RepID=A0A7G5XUL3_9PLAT|nr:NADH dehydrogenase subunit 3 [Syndesmis echinorum]QNA49648.1 NADH dehydrogenase subunit 3 [Syndesmis echinorum]